MRIHQEHIAMSAQELTDVIAVAARYEWLKRHPLNMSLLALLPPASWDRHIDSQMTYTVPTMGEEGEEAMSQYVCQCGQPMRPGWLHSTDKVCYQVGDASGS